MSSEKSKFLDTRRKKKTFSLISRKFGWFLMEMLQIFRLFKLGPQQEDSPKKNQPNCWSIPNSFERHQGENLQFASFFVSRFKSSTFFDLPEEEEGLRMSGECPIIFQQKLCWIASLTVTEEEKGRSKTKWIGGVLEDLKTLKVRNEKSAAVDRSKWRSCSRPSPYLEL